jgi:hypothetical protein
VFTSAYNNTFVLNTTMANFSEASRTCNMYGWHLAMFDDAIEQNQVEGFFATSSYLLPTFHQQYWMGLLKRNGASWSFMDPNINTTYTNYNKPNVAANLCGAAYFQFRKGTPSAYGWGDMSCATRSIFMCRNTGRTDDTQRGWAAQAAGAPSSAALGCASNNAPQALC